LKSQKPGSENVSFDFGHGEEEGLADARNSELNLGINQLGGVNVLLGALIWVKMCHNIM
jgi:hypothetical protein